MKYLCLIGLLLMTATACSSRDPAVEQTVVAQHATLSTEIANRRQTATLGAEQNRVTNEALSTQIRGATDRQQAIVRTLEGFGILVGLELITPVAQAATRSSVQEAAITSGSGGVTLIPPTSEVPFDNLTPTVIANTNLNLPPTIDPTLPNLTNVSVSSSVGSDDCATGSASAFEVSTPELYAVGTANNFPAGISVTFSWLRDGELVYSDTFTWEFEVDGVCVWYFVTPEEFEFLPGAYSVTFERDGAPVAAPVNFILTDANAAESSGTAEAAP